MKYFKKFISESRRTTRNKAIAKAPFIMVTVMGRHDPFEVRIIKSEAKYLAGKGNQFEFEWVDNDDGDLYLSISPYISGDKLD